MFCGQETCANTPPLAPRTNDPLNQDFQFWMCRTREVIAVCFPLMVPNHDEQRAHSAAGQRLPSRSASQSLGQKKIAATNFLRATHFPARVFFISFSIAVVILITIYWRVAAKVISLYCPKTKCLFLPVFILSFCTLVALGILRRKDPFVPNANELILFIMWF